jgi:MerR family mercuric resistance operon transcriptional regulator
MRATTAAPTAAMTIGTLSRHTGCKIETIRYYERVGVLPAPARSEGGHRLYTTDHLRRLTFVRRARDLGFSLEAVRELLRLADGRGRSCAEVAAVARGHLDDIRAKIANLRRLEAVLDDLLAHCQGATAPDCPIIEALYRPR